MKRPLLVFAGQSNMMGAAALPPPRQIVYRHSFEYLHKPRRLGAPTGQFKAEAFPVGEFSYKSIVEAYGEGATPDRLSTLADYKRTTFFVPAMANVLDAAAKTETPFPAFSEADFQPGTSLAPYLVAGLEEMGHACAFTHAAKGSVSIRHYLEGDAAAYFDEKVRDFFRDAETRFAGDDLTERALIWLQGESDADKGKDFYKEALATLWARARSLGFTKFLIIRIGYWCKRSIIDVMRAAEEFCAEREDAFILTRVLSYFDYPKLDHAGWFKDPLPPEFTRCRDSYLGFKNTHVNDEGFRVLAKYALPNLIRTVYEGKPSVPEAENMLPLLDA